MNKGGLKLLLTEIYFQCSGWYNCYLLLLIWLMIYLLILSVVFKGIEYKFYSNTFLILMMMGIELETLCIFDEAFVIFGPQVLGIIHMHYDLCHTCACKLYTSANTLSRREC